MQMWEMKSQGFWILSRYTNVPETQLWPWGEVCEGCQYSARPGDHLGAGLPVFLFPPHPAMAAHLLGDVTFLPEPCAFL